MTFDRGKEIYTWGLHRGVLSCTLNGTSGSGWQRGKERSFYVVTEKSVMHRNLEAIESKRRKRIEGSRKEV